VLLAADILCICGFFVSVTDFFPVIYSWALVHQSSMFRVLDVLLVIQLLSMNGFLLSVRDFFPVCHGLHRVVVSRCYG